jgi:hypothetical protein
MTILGQSGSHDGISFKFDPLMDIQSLRDIRTGWLATSEASIGLANGGLVSPPRDGDDEATTCGR